MLKLRVLHAIHIINGPFRRKGELVVHVDDYSERGRAVSTTLEVQALRRGVKAVNSSLLAVQIVLVGDQLRLEIPRFSTLSKATFFGWSPVWDGTVLEGIVQGASSGDRFEVSIPAQGWWRVTFHSASIYFYPTQKSVKSPREALAVSIKNILTSTAGHLSFLGLILSVGLLQAGWLKKFFQEEQLATAPTGVALVQSSGSSLAQNPDEEFSGISLFQALNRIAAKTLNAESISAGLKNLTGLIARSSQAKNHPEAPSGAPNTNLNTTFKNLQSGINAHSASTAGAAAVASNSPTVHWKSQFRVESGNQAGSGVTEGQQKKILDTFNGLQDRFRSCYETALLKFDEMSVTVVFEGDINRSGGVSQQTFDIRGRTTPEASSSLKACLSAVVSSAKLDPKLSGTHIRNQFIFKS